MKKDLTGMKFGRLTVIEPAKKHGKRTAWKCVCDCGKTVEAITCNLTRGHSLSCGCLKKERLTTHGLRSRTWSHPLYGVWDNMRQRCLNPNATGYHRYGGRGIQVCKEWADSFECFFAWAMKAGYQKGLQIDRADNDGDYCPENCRWVTRSQNQNNRSTNRFIECNGERHTVAEWSRITGISRKALDYRIKAGKTPEEILTKRTAPTRSMRLKSSTIC